MKIIYIVRKWEIPSNLDNRFGKGVLWVWNEVWTKNFNFVCKIFQPNHWGTIWRDTPLLRYFDSNKYRVNSNKGSTIKLTSEINSWDSNGRFDNLTSSELRERRDEYERQYLMEIPPEQECKIM